MWERAFTFREFVSIYGLTRSEGAVLRYLSDAFKALRSGVPAAARTEEVTDLVEWLGELVRQVDSIAARRVGAAHQPGPAAGRAGGGARPAAPADRQRAGVHRDGPQRAVPAGGAVRPAALVRPRRCWTPAPGWTAERWEEVVRAYFAEHDEVRHRRRRPRPGAADHRPAEPGVWRVRQILDDPAGDHDWGFDVEVDLEASDEEGVAGASAWSTPAARTDEGLRGFPACHDRTPATRRRRPR